MEARFGSVVFSSKLDSGNLARVEKVEKGSSSPPSDTSSTGSSVSGPSLTPGYEFNVWTQPDSSGTEHENGNRTGYSGVNLNSQYLSPSQELHPSIYAKSLLLYHHTHHRVQKAQSSTRNNPAHPQTPPTNIKPTGPGPRRSRMEVSLNQRNTEKHTAPP